MFIMELDLQKMLYLLVDKYYLEILYLILIIVK